MENEPREALLRATFCGMWHTLIWFVHAFSKVQGKAAR